MTELLVNLSSFPVSPKKPDVVFRAPGSVFRNTEMRHSRSEDLLGPGARSPSPPAPAIIQAAASEDDLVAASALSASSPIGAPAPVTHAAIVGGGGGGGSGAGVDDNGGRKPMSALLLPPRVPGSPTVLADRIDPEDSIRDIVTENDLYRFVLFKRHYDKYVALAARYEEARGLAYYLEERYHEVKAERDKLEETRLKLERRLEGCEAELKDKEEELFLQLERSLRLEDEVERARQEREACLLARERLEREQASALRQLQIQAAQNEVTRKSLERARQEVVRQATAIRAERDALERENEVLKERLRLERDELGEERRRNEEGVAALTHEAATLRHAARHLRAAALHATSCRRRRRCSVCSYARRTFRDVDDIRDDGKLFKCLQAPLQDLRTWLRPVTPGPESQQQQQQQQLDGSLGPLRTSSPLDQSAHISYIDDSAGADSSSSSGASDDEAYSINAPGNEISLSSTVSSGAPATARAFSSDSGFSSELGDRRSRSYECGNSSRKISESSSNCEPTDSDNSSQPQRASNFTRSRWTSSFRRLLGRSKSKCGKAPTSTPASSPQSSS